MIVQLSHRSILVGFVFPLELIITKLFNSSTLT